jgi:integrase
MARSIHRLSPAKIQKSKPGMHADGGGLYLQATVGPDGGIRRSWIFRYATNARERAQGHGRERQMGLGPLHTVSLAEARKRAEAARLLRLDGLDPIKARHDEQSAKKVADAKVMTFEECAKQYIAAHRSSWRNERHAQQWADTLRDYVYPVIGKLPVGEIDTGLVLKVLRPIWNEKPETASRVRGRIEVILDYATTLNRRRGENPARWKGHLENVLPKKSKLRSIRHHPALRYAEIGTFMLDLRKHESVVASALEFTILTAARTGEALGARWCEIDLQARIWAVPAARMKGGREHRVPLPDAAIAVLERMASVRENDFVFPGGRLGRLSAPAMAMLLRRMGRRDLTVHGFRSTFRDWTAELTSFPPYVVERALAHTIPSAVEAAYQRSDLFEKRRQLMNHWAEYCAKPAESAGVVPLRQAEAAVPA